MSNAPLTDSPETLEHDAEGRIKLALESAEMGVWEWVPAEDRMCLDTAMLKLLDVAPGQFGGRLADFLELVHPGDRERLAAALHFTTRPTLKYDTEFRVTPGEAKTRILRARGRVFSGQDGKPARIVGLAWDVSNRRSAEEAHARDRHLLSMLMDHIPDAIYFKDLESRLIAVNPAMLRHFNMTDASQILGKTDLDLFGVDHAFQAMENERQIIETGQPIVNLEELETWADGSVTWVSTTKMVLRDPRGRVIGTFGISRDITQRKKAEQELARVAAELRGKNQALQEDLEMARELQNALLPQGFPCFPRGAMEADSAIHFHHFFHTSSTVGGDFFDVFEIEENVAGLFICDVMGHGVRAALVASILRALVNELQPVWKNPSEFLEQLNRALRRILKHTRVPLFASAAYAVADLTTGKLTHANAGHPCPVRLQGTTSPATFHRLEGKLGPALGLLDNPHYPATETAIVMPETILFFTDGLFEVEAPDGTLYDYKALCEDVRGLGRLHAAGLCEAIVNKVSDFAGHQEFSDDVCLVAMEIDRLACS